MFVEHLRAGIRGVLQLMSSIVLDRTQAHEGKRGPAGWGGDLGVGGGSGPFGEDSWGSGEGAVTT